jgi:thiol reductant ABC exporter CydC subunit
MAGPFTRWMAVAVLLGFATIGSGIGLLTTSAYLIAKAALHPSIAELQVAIVGVRFFGISRGASRYLERLVSHDVTFRLLARLRVFFYQRLEPLAPARLMQVRSGDLLARIVADVETLQDFFLRVMAPPVVAMLVALAATLLVGSFDSRLGITLLGFLLLAGLGLPLLTWAASRRAGRRLVRIRAGLSEALVDGIQGVADLLAFGQEARHLHQVASLNRELDGLQGHMAAIEGLHSGLMGLLMNLATLAVLLVAISLVSHARLDAVYLGLLILAVVSSFEAVQPLPQAYQSLGASLEAARRLFEISDAQPAVADPPSPLPLPDRVGLRVEDLRFAYQPGQPAVLDGVSFDLPQGARLAIVGPSGAGKTTLVHLLLRFWDYREGKILLGGQELRLYGQEELRRLIAVVSQHTYLFNATIRENLILARPEVDEAEVVQAAKQAQLHNFIQSLPEGYDTWIGEQGLRLSAGQRQRLAIARAILKGAPILILDEPTANLDALTERDVMAALQQLMIGRTSLLITHRLVGLEAADEVLVLRAGRIVECGKHHDLVQKAGFYRRMWDLQRQAVISE